MYKPFLISQLNWHIQQPNAQPFDSTQGDLMCMEHVAPNFMDLLRIYISSFCSLSIFSNLQIDLMEENLEKEFKRRMEKSVNPKNFNEFQVSKFVH